MCVYYLDVNGKVVHLVERAPPRTRTADSRPYSMFSNLESENVRRNDGHENHRASPFIRSIDGMVMGAMAIPMNTNTGVSKLCQ